MRTWAELNSENIVTRVIVAGESDASDQSILEFLSNVYGGKWLETFEDGSLRYNYAGIGYTYDENRDAFIPPTPDEPAEFDEATCRWIDVE